MKHHGQVFELQRRGGDGERLWAYRYRLGGRDSKRVQRGGFACASDAANALERALERVRRERQIHGTLTLAELVDEYLVQHWRLDNAWPTLDRRARRALRPLRPLSLPALRRRVG
jgi:hypothetical protein